MRIPVRSLRQLGHTFQKKNCVLISNIVSEVPCSFEKTCHFHSSAFTLLDRASDTNLFKSHPFITISTRALSIDAEKLTNEGSSLFGSQFSLCWIGEGFNWDLFFLLYLYSNLLFWLQKQIEAGLLLSTNEELLVVN